MNDLPSQEEIAKMYTLVDEVLTRCAEMELGLGELVKISAAMVVRGFETVDELSPEEYEKAVLYYANASTATVNFLQEGRMPPDDPDFLNQDPKQRGTLQ